MYSPEILTKYGYTVTTVSSKPNLSMLINDNNYEGLQTYNVKYTDYLGVEQVASFSINFIQTGCKGGVAGLAL